MGNECCTNCNNGAKQKELQDNVMKETVNPTNGDQLPSQVIEEQGMHSENFSGNQKIVANKAPDQSTQQRNSSISGSIQNDRRISAQNDFYQDQGDSYYRSSSKQKEQKRSTPQNYLASTNTSKGQTQGVNTPNPNSEGVMVQIHEQGYDPLYEIEKILSSFDNVDLINKDRCCMDINPSTNEIYKNEKTGDMYVGEVRNQKKHGFGRLICQNSTFYEGYWENDKKNGLGFMLDNEGNYIKGQFKDNKPDGKCLIKKKDGGVYEGDMKDGEREGYGEETTVKGMRYKGYFKNGKMHGKGDYTIQNMYSFSGSFVNDFIEGEGRCEWKTKKTYYGQWHENRMHGKGEFTWPDGKKYTGDFYQDQFDGYGEFIWSNGTCFKGQWKQGKMHGSGKITTPEGKEISGNWANGEYQSQNLNANSHMTQNEVPFANK